MNMAWSRSFKGLTAFFLSGALLAGAAASAYAQAQSFNVREMNFRIDGVPATVRAGAPITFNVTAEGNPHNLAIDGNGVNIASPGPNISNASGTISFAALQPGSYKLFCPVGQHRANGMEVTLNVVAGAATLPATGGAALPLGLAAAGLASGAAGLFLRRRG